MADDSRRRSRSGSETRKTLPPFPVRYTPAEREEVKACADRVGLSMGAYIRIQSLAKPKIQARKNPTVELVALARLQGELNRIGSNIHQLLKDVRFGGTPGAQDVREAFALYRETIEGIKALLRRSEP